MKKRRAVQAVAAAMAGLMMMTGCSSGGVGEDSGSADGDYTQVTFATWTINTMPSEDAIQTVEDAINEITREEIGVEVDLKLYSYTDYFQQISLGMQGGEKIDVFTTYGNFSNAVSTDMCMDITDLIEEHAPDALALINDEWLAATTVDGKVYGIPAWMPTALATNVLYRSDITDELGIDMSQVESVEDLTDILRQVKEAYPNMYPVVGGAGVNGGMSGLTTSIPQIDYLGDDMYSPAGVLIGDDTTVVNLFETEEYKEMVTLARQWHEEGLIMQDLATTTLSNVEILSGGNGFLNITLQGSSPDAVANGTAAQTGQQLASFNLGNGYLDTATVNTNAWCIASTSEVPEAALDFLNLTYSNADIINLIVYGIEGRDYVIQDDGSVAPPEGQDATSVPYPGYYILTGSWSMGEMYRMAGTTEEDVQFSIEANNNAECSSALGFTFKKDSVQTEYTAVSNVIKQYYSALDCGSVDPEEELPKFIQALKDAGIDTIIAEKQAQLDEWLANNQ